MGGTGSLPETGALRDVRERLEALAPSANLGHRGMGSNRRGHPYPENSLASFRAALARGADGVELDIALTTDGEVVVLHDDTLERTTDGTGYVGDRTLLELERVRLLDGDGRLTNETLPTLAEVYRALPDDCLINVEVKVRETHHADLEAHRAALVDRVLAVVMRFGDPSRTIFSSFDGVVVERVKARQPSFYCAIVSNDPTKELVERAVALKQDAIHPDAAVELGTVQAALDAGLQVNVWKANTKAQMRAQLAKGCTGIITDEPGILQELLAESA